MTQDFGADRLTMRQALKEVWADAGIQGLYRGGGIRAFYIGIGGFAFFGMYERIKAAMMRG